jgi:hypothetical protein
MSGLLLASGFVFSEIFEGEFGFFVTTGGAAGR